MKNHVTAIAAAALLALAVQSASAGNVVGYNKIVVPANTDVRLSVPFTQTIQGTYTVAGKTGSSVTTSEALSASTYAANAYYVRFVSGNASGLWATISANGANSLTLADANVANLVNNGDTFRVYAHATLGTLFPKGMYGKSYTSGTVVNIYANNIAAMAQNKASAKTASYTTTGGGRWVGAGVSNATVLVPETQFILRNGSAQQLTMMTFGIVPDYTVSMLIAPGGDLFVGMGYPMAVVLKNSGLGGTNQRTVFFYDNAATGINKSAVKTASYTTTGGGRWVGAGVTGNELLLPSQTVTFRLPAGETGTKVTIPKPY